MNIINLLLLSNSAGTSFTLLFFKICEPHTSCLIGCFSQEETIFLKETLPFAAKGKLEKI